jgi:molybdate transport system substrate-binding protein
MSAAARALAALFFASLAAAPLRAAPPELTVSVAANLRPACEQLGSEFEALSGIRVLFNFGSTGKLAAQIEQGAPVDLLIAADTDTPESLERRGLALPGSRRVYARGRLVLWSRGDGVPAIDDLKDLTRPEVHRVAIADPRLSPYGQAAQEALQAAGVWEQVRSKIVPAENVTQALQYAETGNVEAVLVARSLCVQGQGRWVLVPAEMHRPLDQALVVIRGGPHAQEALRFARYLLGPEGRRVLQSFGYEVPEP